MKTAISLPNPLFEASEKLAKRMGMTRSELFTRALSAFVAEHDYEEDPVTAKLNEIYAVEDSSLDPVAVQLQALSIPPEEW
ncbi:MAG: ribbon-helix-helix domain-containing protein [Caldilineaceae bacterium]